MTQPDPLKIPGNFPVVIDVELHEGHGDAARMDENGVSTAKLKMYMVNTLLSNGSGGPVVYSAEAMWKMFVTLHEVFGDAYHKMMDDPEKYKAEYEALLKKQENES